MDLRTSAAVCTRSRKPPQSGELDMHELRSGPTKVKGLRRRGQTHTQTHRHTDIRFKGFRALPSFRAYENIYCWPGLAGLAGLAWQGGVEEGGGREEVHGRGGGRIFSDLLRISTHF